VIEMLQIPSPAGNVLTAFIQDRSPAKAVIGPIYGGRRTACIALILGLAAERRFWPQEQWRWAILGPSLNGLNEITIPAVHTWLTDGRFDPKSKTHQLAFDPGDGAAHLLELHFLAMDQSADRKRFLDGSWTAIWLDDARGLGEEIFDAAIERMGSHPAPIQGGALWSGVIASSRMPTPSHWLITRSAEGGDLKLFRQPGGRTPEAENVANLRARGRDYGSFARGRPPEWVRVNIDAELGASAAETALEADRQAARNSFSRYISIIAPDIVPALHHQLLIHTLERVARGELKRAMFFLPPGSAKSTYASILFPPWYMGRNPTHSVILASHARELAERFGRRVRNTVSSAPYRDIFGFGLAADSGAAGRWENQRGGEFYAVGVDGSVTGRRADLGIIDDPVKGRAEADSPTVREHTWQWYQSDFWTRLKPGAALLYIGTRWNDGDLAGRLIEEMKNGGEQWEIISVPAIAKEDDPLGRQPGDRLWPEWFSEEMFDTAQRDTRNWSALYQQEPMPESGDYFRQDWIRWYDSPLPRDEIKTYGASDYAVTANGGDYTVHLVVGVDPHDDIYLIDQWRDRTASDQWVEAVLDLMAWWKPLAWAEEKGQIEKGVGPFLTKRALERKIFCFRRQFTSAADKATRAQPIRGRMAMGKVYFPRRPPWVSDFVQELLRFPAGKNDDRIDALALIGRMLDEMVPGSKPKKQEPIRGMEALTLDQLFELTAPGKPYGHPRAIRPAIKFRVATRQTGRPDGCLRDRLTKSSSRVCSIASLIFKSCLVGDTLPAVGGGSFSTGSLRTF
jgi:predicted phage terminase large subunit-like protein